MFDSYGGESDGEGGPGFIVCWRGGEADYEPWRLDKERPWAVHETPVSGDRDGYVMPDPPPADVEQARARSAEMFECLTEKQQFVLQLYWGIGQRAHRTYTFEQIGVLMGGISKQAVAQIHSRAIATLQRKYA